MKDGIPYRNHSPHGWWVASYVLRATWDDEAGSDPTATFLVWENTIILRASDRSAAYEKALRFAAEAQSEFEDSDSPGRNGRWNLEGLTSLLPIYDELEDGAEILWKEHEAVPLEKLRSWVKSKSELEVFDDTPGPGDAV
jgi:hypothetical protein